MPIKNENTAKPESRSLLTDYFGAEPRLHTKIVALESGGALHYE